MINLFIINYITKKYIDQSLDQTLIQPNIDKSISSQAASLPAAR
jgi:hypothetical protein